MILDYIMLAFAYLKQKRLRAWLTIIGIFIGVAAIVSLISLAQGMQAAISAQFQRIGTNKIIITQKGAIGGIVGGAFVRGLSDHDLELVRKTNGVSKATGVSLTIAPVRFNDHQNFIYVVGLEPDENGRIFTEIHADVAVGRFLSKADTYKTLATYRLYTDTDIFGRVVKLNDKITIAGKSFDVVGLVARIGSREDDTSLWVPIDTERTLFNLGTNLTTIVAEVSDQKYVDVVSESIKKTLRSDRGEKKGEESFDVQTSGDLLASFNTILSIVQWVLIGIAAISLLVGGIGIMNTMYTSVLERTREIGVMKAVGAKNSDIMVLFVLESGLIGLIGGVVGIALGIGLSTAVGYVASQALGTTLIRPAFPYYLTLGSLAFSFLVGTISGTLPAIQASKLKPVEALRYE